MLRFLISLCVAALGLATACCQQSIATSPGVSTDTVAAAPAVSQATNAASFTVIGYIEQRDRVITIKSGGSGIVYSVSTRDGKVLFENLDTKQLQARAPELYRLVKTGVATGSDRPGAVRDARVIAIDR